MTEPVRMVHGSPGTAALHILLTVAMHRLGLMVMEATQEEYEEAAEGTADLRVAFNGTVYRAERLP